MTPISSPHSKVVIRAVFWALSAIFLALAISANGGRYSSMGMVWLSLSLLSAIGGVFPPNFKFDSVLSLNGVLVAGATLFAAFWIFPGKSAYPALIFLGCWAVCIALAVVLMRLSRSALLKKSLFPIFLLLQVTVGVLTITQAHDEEQNSGKMVFHVRNDVQIFAQEGARLLLEGKNPYSARMPNVMGRDMPFYFPNATGEDGRLPFGYMYMPLSVIFSLPGHLLGDFRLAHVFALIGAAWFLAYARPSTTSQLAATVFLMCPPVSFILAMSWTEPVAIFFLAATLFCYYRAPKWLFLALGCLFASKQYTVFLLPLLPLLVPEKEKRWPLVWQSLGVAALITLPMALWDVDGFYRSVVQMQFKQPFRPDSLSYLVTVLRAGSPQLSPIVGFAALLIALVAALKVAPRYAASWCGAGGVAFLAFFAFNKQAFANYYFWVFSLLIAAVAVALPPTVEHEESSPKES
jgi:hypothetical protein